MKPEDLKLQEEYPLYIGGQWMKASDGETFTATSPADGRFLAKVAEATKEDVDAAVDAAWQAFASWRHTSVKERADVLNRIADAIEANLEHLAMTETMDNGKALRETMNIDVPLAADHFRYFASTIIAEEDSAKMLDNQTLNLILREPLGVIGQIVPWNFPFLMAAWKLAPVIAAGDCTVFKPSSSTSLSVLELARLTQDIIPAGVFNVITGSGSKSGQFLLDHPQLSKLAFTGSTEIGRGVAKAASEKLIPATLELGGKSANIIYDDADMELALDGIQLGILFNQGEVCASGSRIFVQEGIYDEFMKKAVARFEAVKLGLPWEDGVQMGTQTTKGQQAKVLNYVKIAQEEGATVLCGGEAYTENGTENGAFVKPTLIADANNQMRVAREEIFGPVAVVIKFKDEAEVIAMANDSVYGLGGGVFTTNLNKAIRTARGVETGRMWVNTFNTFPAGAPFGGVKESGIGRETHKMILDQYTQAKNIIINLSEEPSGLYPFKG